MVCQRTAFAVPQMSQKQHGLSICEKYRIVVIRSEAKDLNSHTDSKAFLHPADYPLRSPTSTNETPGAPLLSTRTQPCTIDRAELEPHAQTASASPGSGNAAPDFAFAPAPNSPLARFAGIDAQLNGSSVDLKSVCDAIRRDPLLAGRVVQLSRALAGESGSGISCIEEAVVLQGAERFRMTLLSAALLDLRSRAAYPLNDPGLVRHGVLSALAGERLARRARYPRADLAYLFALVHPLGNSRGRRICRWSRDAAAEAEADSPERVHDGNSAASLNERAAIADWHFDPPLASLLGGQLKMHEVRLEPALVRIVELACTKACARSREVLEWSCALEALGN